LFKKTKVFRIRIAIGQIIEITRKDKRRSWFIINLGPPTGSYCLLATEFGDFVYRMDLLCAFASFDWYFASRPWERCPFDSLSDRHEYACCEIFELMSDQEGCVWRSFLSAKCLKLLRISVSLHLPNTC